MDLFGFLKTLFANSETYDEMNNNKRGKYFFMTNRLSSVKFPVIANKFNRLDINAGQVVNSWHDIYKRLGNVPSWIYAASKKEKLNNKIVKSKIKFIPKDDTILLYCYVGDITHKEVAKLVEIYPTEFESEIKDFEEGIDPDIRRS